MPYSTVGTSSRWTPPVSDHDHFLGLTVNDFPFSDLYVCCVHYATRLEYNSLVIKSNYTCRNLDIACNKWWWCERFELRSHFKSRLSLIVRVNVVLNRTVVANSDWHFDNLCGSHLQSESELYHVSWWYYTLVIVLIG